MRGSQTTKLWRNGVRVSEFGASMTTAGGVKPRRESVPKSDAVSPHVTALRSLLSSPDRQIIGHFRCEPGIVEVVVGHESVWAVLRRPGRGGFALRSAYLAGAFSAEWLGPTDGILARLRIESAAGVHEVRFANGDGFPGCLRMTVTLTPSRHLLIPFVPRDLYPLDREDDPTLSRGKVKAAQRGLNGGLLYLSIDKPDFGDLLYFQNLTAMNDYYRATDTTPDSAVGGEWPELGYLLPTPPQSASPPVSPLKARRRYTLSDAILLFGDGVDGERPSAKRFIDWLGRIYLMIDRPTTEFRDWVGRAERTLRDLDKAPEATIRHYGHRYIHPYVAAEYPDSMVQLATVQSIHEWGRWCGQPHPLEEEFAAGLGRFFDKALGTVRRYLPNVGNDKDADAVDSWYLYHPLMNLGRLALEGDDRAGSLFRDSLDFAIKAARHFRYEWPVQFKVTDFSIITKDAGDSGRGQTDVGGIYAWVMIQAYELTADDDYLAEARKAIEATRGLHFDINYQANLTAWGAAACVKLHRLTGERFYLEQAYVFFASFLHNCEIWESEIGHAVHYRNFLGATALHDAHYMAIYECFDSFAAMKHMLADGDATLSDSARMLASEYCKYALDRAWYYYPDALPPEAVSPKQRDSNGHLDRKLSFPVEDLYADGQQAGQVGQEIYGAGAAFCFATRTFHSIGGAPFWLACDHFVSGIEIVGPKCVRARLAGVRPMDAAVYLVRRKHRRMPDIRVSGVGGSDVRFLRKDADRVDYRVPAGGAFEVRWT